MTTDRAIAKFVELRDQVAVIKKEQQLALAPYNAALNTLEAWLLEDLDAAGVESMRATTGTVYKSIRTSAKVTEWMATLDFIIEHGAWELLEARVAKTAVEQRIADTQQPVPGVELSREVSLNVRRA